MPQGMNRKIQHKGSHQIPELRGVAKGREVGGDVCHALILEAERLHQLRMGEWWVGVRLGYTEDGRGEILNP